MSCSIDAIKENLVDKASDVLNKKVKGFKEVRPGVFELNKNANKSLNKVYEDAESARNDVMAWAGKTYGKKFQFGWTKLDRAHPNKVTVSIQVPYATEQLLRVKLGLISIEEANEVKPFLKDAERISKDALLDHQEFISDTQFYESIEENIPTLAKTKYELNEDGIYDESLEFEYDKTQETDTMITDAELFRLLNDDLNIC